MRTIKSYLMIYIVNNAIKKHFIASHENNQKFRQIFFFSNYCRNIDEMKKRCDHFLTKNRFICLQICSII